MSHRAYVQQGALFQLSQVAYFQLKKRIDDSQPAIIGIEMLRPAYTLVNGNVAGKPYNRKIDIVVEGKGSGERWIETKSLMGKFKPEWFKNTLIPKGKERNGPILNKQTNYRGYYRQFFHDMRLNDKFINEENRDEILDFKIKKWVGNSEFNWYFHKFKKNPKSGNPPTNKDEKNARTWFCAKPEIQGRKSYYDSNMSGNASAIKIACQTAVGNLLAPAVELRDTQSYLTELVEPHAADLGVDDFISFIKEIAGN